MRVSFIGSGVMGQAMISAVLAQGLARAEEILASDPLPERRSALQQGLKVGVTGNNREAAAQAEMVVLAVKPQNLPEVLAELRGQLRPDQLALSIVAGATLQALTQGLGHQAVVRAMPNTPAQVREGITLWTATSAVKEAQREKARSLLAALGKEIYVGEEKYLDMATAVSGSGPAYLFLVLEAFTDAAVHIGLPREMAVTMVLQTTLGAAKMAEQTGKHPAELRNMVTSPGGTTTEGLLALEEGGLRALFSRAVIAAYEKTKLLGGTTKP